MPLRALLEETFDNWSKHEAPRLGASLAFYAVFSLAPLLVITVGVISFFYRRDTAGQIQSQLQKLVGSDAAATLAQAIHSSTTHGNGIFATILGFVVLLIGAGGVFTELHNTLNKIWKVSTPNYGTVMGMVRDRVASFAMVFGIAFVLMLSMVLTALLPTVIRYFNRLVPGIPYVWTLGDIAISFVVVSLLLSALFRYLPDATLEWRDVWVGAFVTAALFTIGKFAIAFYLGHSAVRSMYGAAGSVIVLLVWVYYTAQILFLGAEFTHAYASRHGYRPGFESREAA